MRQFEEAIILAAGRGTRLGQAAEGGPKCLVDVAGRTILEHQMGALHDTGVRRFVIVTGFESDKVEAAARRILPAAELVFVQNEAFATTNVLTSWRLGAAELTKDHIYAHGDTVFAPELLVRLSTDPAPPVLLSMDGHPCDDEAMKIRCASDDVVEISKTMENTSAAGEFTGVMAVSADVMPELVQVADTLLGEATGESLFMEAVLQHLIDSGRGSLLGVADITGVPWREIDFLEDLEAAREAFGRL